MLKHYYVKRGEFANQYWLNYTSNAAQDRAAVAEGCERITYKEARPFVVEKIGELIEKGVYPRSLWG